MDPTTCAKGETGLSVRLADWVGSGCLLGLISIVSQEQDAGQDKKMRCAALKRDTAAGARESDVVRMSEGGVRSGLTGWVLPACNVTQPTTNLRERRSCCGAAQPPWRGGGVDPMWRELQPHLRSPSTASAGPAEQHCRAACKLLHPSRH